MAWTTPKTDWTTGDLVAASDLNAIGDNLNHFKSDDRYKEYQLDTDKITTLGTYADVDATNMSFDLTTNGGIVLCGFRGVVSNDAGSNKKMSFTVEVDDVVLQDGDGIVSQSGSNNDEYDISFVVAIPLTAGQHTLNLQWKTTGGDAKLHSSEFTQFWAVEL